ncbi:hypothetical protein BDF20DRAFT_832944 [Mycotypha africana]|uniref:uncharacterized protein n=1 Tax=Mycotypha africana TaxID=64632 RepID=UPI002300AF9C|nr:uncharacterized protein BDF20DRAFT_832944 [Mycotypha africana]KAI8988062.1 hypothetical protein BDF20DRAFT_832944 [Mycotypha africana]
MAFSGLSRFQRLPTCVVRKEAFYFPLLIAPLPTHVSGFVGNEIANKIVIIYCQPSVVIRRRANDFTKIDACFENIKLELRLQQDIHLQTYPWQFCAEVILLGHIFC